MTATKSFFDRVIEVFSPEADKIKEELKKVKGFIEVDKKVDEIRKRLAKTLSDDPDYEDFANKLADLVKSHKFFSDKGKGKDKNSDK